MLAAVSVTRFGMAQKLFKSWGVRDGEEMTDKPGECCTSLLRNRLVNILKRKRFTGGKESPKADKYKAMTWRGRGRSAVPLRLCIRNKVL